MKFFFTVTLTIIITIFSSFPQTSYYFAFASAIDPPSPHEQTIEALIKCESGGNPNAYNPKDNDGLPKYGILQFRLETFQEQAIKYKILPKGSDFKTLVWEEQLQREVAIRMLEDNKGYRWGCYFKI